MRKPSPSRVQRLLLRRYAYLREHGRCVQCAEKMPDGDMRARCAKCGKRNQRARAARVKAKRTPSTGCPRCFLRGAHVCLPGIVAYAGIRRTPDIL